jgi:hypothetical protein
MIKALQRWLAKAGPLLFHWLGQSWRIRVRGRLPEGPCVVVVWHGEILPMLVTLANRNYGALVSLSRDGSLITQLLIRWGYEPIRGSSSKRGVEALREMIAMAHHKPVLVSPDGPRGPARQMKGGALITARKAGVPFILCRIGTRQALHGTGWDRFLIPLPFARITVEFEEFPIHGDDVGDGETILKTAAARLSTPPTP